MVIALAFLFGCLGYVVGASLPFTSLVNHKRWYFGIGIAFGMALNALWLNLARKLPQEHILVYSVLWDAMLTLTYMLVPILLWGQPASWRVWVGVGLIFTGMVVAKL